MLGDGSASNRFNVSNFHRCLEPDISQAYKKISELDSVYAYAQNFGEEYVRECESQFRDILHRVYEKLAFAFELCGLREALRRLDERFDTGENNLTASRLEHYKDDYSVAIRYSPVLDHMIMALEAFLACLGISAAGVHLEHDRQLLLQIVRGTSKLIADRKLSPQNENDVRNEIYGLLLHPFPDTVKDPQLPQVSKVYKPDIGIRSLKALIEYKFADTIDELKKSLEGIYADSRGYSGFEDWSYFIAVLYCTEVFMTDDQLREETKHVGMPDSWRIILVTGSGGRKSRVSKSQKSVGSSGPDARG